MSLGSLLIMFAVASYGSPEPVEALFGCAEALNCASVAACEILEGQECSENGCVGTKVCAGDPNNECQSGPGCSSVECEMLVCVDWIE
jgi:hypothetical protein